MAWGFRFPGLVFRVFEVQGFSVQGSGFRVALSRNS